MQFALDSSCGEGTQAGASTQSDAYPAPSPADSSITISAVIPIYNAEAYIERCISSLKEQDLDDLEFIFVDDASTDNSLRVVEQWASEDSRVRIIRNMNNLGEGASRNAGIAAARGAYFCSLDPDDWIAPDFFELLYAEACRSCADVVKGTRLSIDESSGQELLPRSTLNDRIRQSLAEGQPLYLSFAYEHQSAIFKRELFTQYTLYGVSGNACDTTFLVRICSRAESISFADKAYYFYRKREASATSAYSAKRSFDELLSLEEQLEALRDTDTREASRKYLTHRIRNYMDRLFLAAAQGHVGTEVEAEYCERMGSLVRRISDYEKIYAELPELKVLVEEKRLLPSKSHYDNTEGKAAIVRMTDYLSAVSSTPDELLVQRYLRISSAYIEEQPTRRARIANLVFVLGQVLRLKDPLRRRVFSSLRKRIDFSALLAG